MVKWLWPFDERFPLQEVDGLPEHLKASTRMKNRWRLNGLLPFIQRWFVVLGLLGLSLYIAGYLPGGLVSLLVHIVLFTALWAATCFTAFLVWLYSLRPR